MSIFKLDVVICQKTIQTTPFSIRFHKLTDCIVFVVCFIITVDIKTKRTGIFANKSIILMISAISFFTMFTRKSQSIRSCVYDGRLVHTRSAYIKLSKVVHVLGTSINFKKFLIVPIVALQEYQDHKKIHNFHF